MSSVPAQVGVASVAMNATKSGLIGGAVLSCLFAASIDASSRPHGSMLFIGGLFACVAGLFCIANENEFRNFREMLVCACTSAMGVFFPFFLIALVWFLC